MRIWERGHADLDHLLAAYVSPVRTGAASGPLCDTLVASGLRSDALIMQTDVTSGTISPLRWSGGAMSMLRTVATVNGSGETPVEGPG
jgi:phage terminase large subunit-like protein